MDTRAKLFFRYVRHYLTSEEGGYIGFVLGAIGFFVLTFLDLVPRADVSYDGPAALMIWGVGTAAFARWRKS